MQPVVAVAEPEISKAYYGELGGSPVDFTIVSSVDFHLYVGILVPAAADAAKTPSVEVFRDGQPLVRLDGPAAEWKPFHEEFGGDDYFQGPEYRDELGAGTYVLRVSSPDNRGKYVLAVGEQESFPLSETFAALAAIPNLKSKFFGVPKWTFLLSIFGATSFAAALLLGFLLAWLSRLLLKLSGRTKRTAARNIGRPGRLMRLALAFAALAVGLWVWSPLGFALAGFLLFEAASGWCAINAALGRNTCPR